MFLWRSLAHISYNFFCWYIWGAFPPAPPPPHTKKLATLLPIPTEVITFFLVLFACLSACSAGKRGPFFGEVFFFGGGGGGGGRARQLKIFSAPLRKPKAPPPPSAPY